MALGGKLRQRLTLTVACAAQVMMVLDVLIVSVALPSMQRELPPLACESGVGGERLCPGAGRVDPLWGRTGRSPRAQAGFHGRGRCFHAAASVGCALSVSGGMLVGFRVVQGIGGAVMSSLTLSLISEAYPPEARAAPIGLWAAVSGLAVAGGSVLGGLLLSIFPWSSIFWVNVPIGVLTTVVSAVAVAESREPVPRPFDSMGVALSTSGLLLLTFGFVDSADATWGSPVVGVCVGAGVAVLAAFWVWEHKAASPMVPPSLLRTPSFGRASAVYLLAYLAFSGFIYYVTLFFQNIEGWSPLRTGLSWLFFCIPYFLVAQMWKWVQRWLPVASAVGWGCLIAAAGVFGMSRLTTATPFAWAAACYVLVGVGFALMVPAGSTAADGRGSRGIVGDRVRPVQCLPPDRHRDGTGDPGIHRRQRDPGRLAPPVRVFPASRAAERSAGRCRRRGRPGSRSRRIGGPACPGPSGVRLPPRFWVCPGAGQRHPGCGWSRGLPGPTASPQLHVPGAPANRCEDGPVSRVPPRCGPPSGHCARQLQQLAQAA